MVDVMNACPVAAASCLPARDKPKAEAVTSAGGVEGEK
jgi:hypothetical protein